MALSLQLRISSSHICIALHVSCLVARDAFCASIECLKLQTGQLHTSGSLCASVMQLFDYDTLLPCVSPFWVHCGSSRHFAVMKETRDMKATFVDCGNLCMCGFFVKMSP